MKIAVAHAQLLRKKKNFLFLKKSTFAPEMFESQLEKRQRKTVEEFELLA
jgi:hypothetical protein